LIEEEGLIGSGLTLAAWPKCPLPFRETYLDFLPSAHMYENSDMHCNVFSHIAVSTSDFFLTGSSDGHLKFWNMTALGIEFLRYFQSSLAPMEGLDVSLVDRVKKTT
jgi:peptidylprolyl isomerase domain and WD repeat-containing protein 1